MLTSSGAVTFVHNTDLDAVKFRLYPVSSSLCISCNLLGHLNAQFKSVNSSTAPRKNIHGKLTEVMKARLVQYLRMA